MRLGRRKKNFLLPSAFTIFATKIEEMNNDILLEIRDLHASVGDKEILKGIDLTIKKGKSMQ